MKIKDTLFKEVKIVSFTQKKDIRGTMNVSFNDNELNMAGIRFMCKEQRVYSMPQTGTFFGIHFQLKSHPQDKMIHLLAGRGVDYIVDLRSSSDTYKKWIAIELTGGDNQYVFVPQGYGHAFLSLEDNTMQLFTVNEYFQPDASKQINYKDAQISLEFPVDIAYISETDRHAPYFDDEGYEV